MQFSLWEMFPLSQGNPSNVKYNSVSNSNNENVEKNMRQQNPEQSKNTTWASQVVVPSTFDFSIFVFTPPTDG